jgi:hypothetical protein
LKERRKKPPTKEIMKKTNDGPPVLVNRAEAQSLCGVTPSQFDRLVRSGRLENFVMAGPGKLYRSAQCLAIAAKRSTT